MDLFTSSVLRFAQCVILWFLLFLITPAYSLPDGAARFPGVPKRTSQIEARIQPATGVVLAAQPHRLTYAATTRLAAQENAVLLSQAGQRSGRQSTDGRPTAALPNVDRNSAENVDAMNDSFLSYRARGLEALQSGQYERAKELFTVALELNPRDPVTLYQLGVVEFNLGRAEEGRARLEQAHTALPLKTNPNVVELHVEGDYTFVPVNKDEWSLHLKGKTTRPGEGLPESGEPPSAFLLDVDAVYEMEVARAEDDARKSSRSRALISIPIGLMLVWLFAR